MIFPLKVIRGRKLATSVSNRNNEYDTHVKLETVKHLQHTKFILQEKNEFNEKDIRK